MALLGSPLFWLPPRRTVVVPGTRLMSGFAALQRTVPHADVEQLSTTVAPRCCRAINHPQSGQAQTEQPPLGMDKSTERSSGRNEGRKQLREARGWRGTKT